MKGRPKSPNPTKTLASSNPLTPAKNASLVKSASSTKSKNSAKPSHNCRRPSVSREIPRSSTVKTKPAQKTASSTDWQNPIIGYWAHKHPRWAAPRPKLSKAKRLEYRILTTLAFFSISVGLWENFRQLWLQQNGFSATDVGNIIGLGTFASVMALLYVGKRVKMAHVKKLTLAMLSFSCVDLLLLAALNGSGWRWLIDICAILDIASSAVITISIYPLLTTVVKNNTAYSRRKLVEYLFRDVGIMIGGIFIGQTIGGLVIDYNACLLIAIIFLSVASLIISRLDLTLTEKAPDSRFSAFKYITHSKLQRGYMVYTFLAGAAYNTAIALKMLMLTDSFGFSAGIATNYLLIVGLCADFIGILALKYFTPKSDYFTMFLKFGLRGILFLIAFLSDSNFVSFIALTWTLLSATAYENVSDGYYINAVDNRHQLKYNTLRYVIHHLGIALGTFLCGQMFQFGPGPIFGLAGIFIIFQLIAAFYLIYIRRVKKAK